MAGFRGHGPHLAWPMALGGGVGGLEILTRSGLKQSTPYWDHSCSQANSQVPLKAVLLLQRPLQNRLARKDAGTGVWPDLCGPALPEACSVSSLCAWSP